MVGLLILFGCALAGFTQECLYPDAPYEETFRAIWRTFLCLATVSIIGYHVDTWWLERRSTRR